MHVLFAFYVIMQTIHIKIEDLKYLLSIMTDVNIIRRKIEEQLGEYQHLLKELETYESLCKFGELGPLERDFLTELDWLLEVWLDNDSNEPLFDAKRVAGIEDKLIELPFEQAVMHKEPYFLNESLHNIFAYKFGWDDSWRVMPETIMMKSDDEKKQIYANFVVMCYYVINAREELLFDICERLGMNANE